MSEKPGNRALRWPLSIDQARSGDAVIFILKGRVGRGASAALSAVLFEAINRGARRLVIDFAEVDYLSSPGLAVINGAVARLSELRGILALGPVSDPVRIALGLAEVSIPIEASRELAVARVLG